MLREYWAVGAKGLKNGNDALLMPPPRPRRVLLDAVASLGIKVLPRVDPCPFESTDEMNVGPRDEVLLVSLDFHMARISSFMAIRSASVALKSSSESRQRASLYTPYVISHSTLMFRTWSFACSQTVG